MNKKITLLGVLVLLACTVFSQTPTFWNFNGPAGANSFPFNTTTSRKVQWRIVANSLGAVTAGNNITAVYFMTGNTASNTYPLLNIRLKQGVPMFAGGGNYETGMTLVYTGNNVSVSSTTGGWIQFILQTPFLYDPSQPLFVEVEHNGTTGSGPTVYQSSPVGPGSGRQYGNYPNLTYNGSDATVAHFGIDVLPATPCTAPPFANTVTPSNFTTCPFLSNPTLSIATTYSFGGITYQWQSSTVSAVGPFNPVSGATLNTAPSGTINTTTWFTCVATCTNPGGGSTTLTPTEYFVAGGVTSTVPYFENFEGLQTTDRLPNCSWYSPNLGSTVKTYLSPQSNNRLPLSGTKFGSFGLPSNNNAVYSNGITMSPGITYSAAINYATEYFGYTNWASLELLVGPNQSPTGLVPVASIAPAASGPYKVLGGTFTVPTAGDYYICFRATAPNGSALYLSWDDLSVTIPCEGPGAVNSPTLIASVSANTICAGDVINCNVSGASTYLWNNGSTNQTTVMTPAFSTVITVSGTNTLTGCVAVATQSILVNISPNVMALSSKAQACPGETNFLSAIGAQSYAWNTGGTGPSIAVIPNATTIYSVVGTNALGCSQTATVAAIVKPAPTVNAVSLNSTDICANETASFTANGAATYQWFSSNSSVVYQGGTIGLPLTSSTTFTVFGLGANGCTGKSTVTQNVLTCTGINQVQLNDKALTVFPNPSTGMFTLQLSTGNIQTVIISDLTGRQIMQVKANGNEVKLNLSSLSDGVYYANVMDENSTQVVRLVKE